MTTRELRPSEHDDSHVAEPLAQLFVWARGETAVQEMRAGEAIVAGRASTSDLVIDDATVSRYHARFIFDGQRVHVDDLGSRNGMGQGSLQVRKAELADGDHLTLGSAVIGVRLTQSKPYSDDSSVMQTYAHAPSEKALGTHKAPRVIVVEAKDDGPAALWLGQTMQQLLRSVRRLGTINVPVLIVGETGTGKELVARELHAQNTRRTRPMRTLNCGAIPPSLVESVLFGHVKGAFTGADQARAGLFEEAQGGCVFLDEIGELPLAAQGALLRVLEARQISRVGSHLEIPVDVRVIAATHRDLDGMADGGTFRLDLLHRLNAVTLQVPPLRERREEIQAFALHFLGAALSDTGRGKIHLQSSVLGALETYRWPGNVRELRNAIVRAVAMCEGELLTLADFPERMREAMPRALPEEKNADGQLVDLRDSLKARENAAIRRALAETGGNKTRAAGLLGMPLRTFHRRVKELEEP